MAVNCHWVKRCDIARIKLVKRPFVVFIYNYWPVVFKYSCLGTFITAPKLLQLQDHCQRNDVKDPYTDPNLNSNPNLNLNLNPIPNINPNSYPNPRRN